MSGKQSVRLKKRMKNEEKLLTADPNTFEIFYVNPETGEKFSTDMFDWSKFPGKPNENVPDEKRIVWIAVHMIEAERSVHRR